MSTRFRPPRTTTLREWSSSSFSPRLLRLSLGGLALLSSGAARADANTAIRELDSTQIKKGVRALGMGGDGATVGNYALVYRDARTDIVDYGYTTFTDGNMLQFTAVGATTPPFWDGAALYLIAMSAWGTGLSMRFTSPAFPAGADLSSTAADQAVYAKFAKPLGHGFSIGLLAGWEHSTLNAVDPGGSGYVSYGTSYLPSGGLGVTWEPTSWLLVGVRALSNNDRETRRDALSLVRGWVWGWEGRAGIAVRPWSGGLIDVGAVGTWRGSHIDGTSVLAAHPVAGFEQALWPEHLLLRVGWDETSPTAGLTAAAGPIKLDVAYAHDLGVDRARGVYGEHDNAVLGTLTLDTGKMGSAAPARSP